MILLFIGKERSSDRSGIVGKARKGWKRSVLKDQIDYTNEETDECISVDENSFFHLHGSFCRVAVENLGVANNCFINETVI